MEQFVLQGVYCICIFMYRHIADTATYSYKYYALFSLPLSTELQIYYQVYEEACEADHTHANQILQQFLDVHGNKWVPTFYTYTCVCVGGWGHVSYA